MFWAITIPITLAVVLVWRAAVYLSGTKLIRVLFDGRRRKKKDKDEEDGHEMRAMTNGSKMKEPAHMVR